MTSSRGSVYCDADEQSSEEFGEVIRRDNNSWTPQLAFGGQQGAYGFQVLRPRETKKVDGIQVMQPELWPAAVPDDFDGTPLTIGGCNPYLQPPPQQPAISACGWQVSSQASQREFKATPRRKTVHAQRRDSNCERQVIRVKEKCKYFQEGRCNRSESCPFSHDFKPPKKLEMCKYYAQSSCRNGDSCVYMHSEWPCKFFHLYRSCSMAGQCKFSHGPTTPETADILQQIRDSAVRPKLTPIAEPSPGYCESAGQSKPAGACVPGDRGYTHRSEIGCCSSSMDNSEDSDQDIESDGHKDPGKRDKDRGKEDRELNREEKDCNTEDKEYCKGEGDCKTQDKDCDNVGRDSDTEDKDCSKEDKSDDKDRGDDTPELEVRRSGRRLKAGCNSPQTTPQPRWPAGTSKRSSRLVRMRAPGSLETRGPDGEPSEEALNAFKRSKRRKKL